MPLSLHDMLIVMTTQALVIGASSAIGSAVAAELADLGYALTLWGRDAARLPAGGVTDEVDLADHAALPAAVERIAARGALGVVV